MLFVNLKHELRRFKCLVLLRLNSPTWERFLLIICVPAFGNLKQNGGSQAVGGKDEENANS